MDKQTIEEGNKLIAEFMEWKIDNSFPDKDRVYRNEKALELDTTFKYHSSWEWLMPVCEKIESLGYYVSIEKECCGISSPYPKEEERTGLCFIVNPITKESKILAVYEAVIQFITHHNTINKDK